MIAIGDIFYDSEKYVQNTKSGKYNPSLIMHDLSYIKSVGLVLKCIFYLNAIQDIKYVRKYSTSSPYVSYKIPINNNKHK